MADARPGARALGGDVLGLLTLGLALAGGDIEPPGPRPPGEVVVVDGLVAMPPPLGRWYEQRHRYAGQLEAQVRELSGRLELAAERTGLWELRVEACEVHLDSATAELAVANRERRWRGVRDGALVGLGAGAVLALSLATMR